MAEVKTQAELDMAIAVMIKRNMDADTVFASKDGNVFLDVKFANFHKRVYGYALETIICDDFKAINNHILMLADRKIKLEDGNVELARQQCNSNDISYSLKDKKVVLIGLLMAFYSL